MNKEIVGYIFELATTIDISTGERGGWVEYIQTSKPYVPQDTIRKLRPLYAGEEIK